MSVVCRLKSGAVSAALCYLVASVAIGQQGQAQGQASGQIGGGRTAAQRDNSSRSATSGQSGRASAGQSDRSTSQGTAAQPGESRELRTANFRGELATAGGAEQAIDQFFGACLLASNQAEVELSELAQQQAQSPEVKQFAEQMIEDHRQMIQQLQPIAGVQGAGTDSAAGRAGAASGTSNTGTQQATTGTSSNLPGSSGASGTTSQSGLSGAAGHSVAHQLAQIDTQIVRRKTQMAKQELEQKSGADFDKCYIGSAIPAHVHALAALEVIGQQSQGQLAEVARQAQPKVQQHLEHAKELMKKLDSQSGSSTSAARADRSRSRQ